MREINERKLVEEALREGGELLTAFMNAAPAVFIIWDSDFNLVNLTEAAMAYLPPRK